MKIRKIKQTDYPLLEDFLYHAIFQPQLVEGLPGAKPLPRDIINKPGIFIYIDNFGSEKSDCGVVAEQDGKIVGAAWTRIIPQVENLRAFGHIDDETPELAISVLPEYRGEGIGAKMLGKLFELLAEKDYKQTSLSVQKANPAVRLYERQRYKTVCENDEDFIMVRDLKKELQSYGISMGICLGVGIGVALGVALNNLALWIGVGMCLGIAVGSTWFATGKKKK